MYCSLSSPEQFIIICSYNCPVDALGGRPTVLAHHGCKGINLVTATSVCDAHGIEEEVPVTSHFLNSILVPSHPLLFLLRCL